MDALGMKADSIVPTDPDIDLQSYATREALAEALALSVAGILAGGIAERGTATLVVSGGSTPKLFFKKLSQCDIDWKNVTVMLVDERIVPPDNDRANAKLIAEYLLQDNAAAAHFLPYVTDGRDADECAEKSEQQLTPSLEHIDVTILGMGTDGHTASFFPGGNHLEEALDMQGSKQVLSMLAEGAGEPRLTLTMPVVQSSRFLALHIEGQEKADVLKTALGLKDPLQMPIACVVKKAPEPVKVFWAP